jgi:hypothetical protein
MSKLFTFAGTCVENGAVVYKFANDANRAKALERFGCTDVNMVELPAAMDKEAAVAYLATVGMTAAKAPRVAKAAKPATVKVKGTKATKVVATKAKRVPAELKPGMDAAAFFDQWMAEKTVKADAWREKNGI